MAPVGLGEPTHLSSSVGYSSGTTNPLGCAAWTPHVTTALATTPSIGRKKMDNRELIDAFTTHLGRQKGYPNLEVDRWPDEENRQSPEIDALAGPFAIEHTSIDALPDQRRADDWYSRIVAGLDREIASFVDCESTGFTIALEFNAIRAGMDWNRVRADLKRWISKHASCLSHGSHSIILPTPTPADSPIVMMVRKDRSGCKGFSRIEPRDNSLAKRVRELLDRKATKLMRYQTAHTSTILLVENGDIALMDDWKMLTAIREAYPDGLPQGVDEIWFADTSMPDKPRFLDSTTEIDQRSQSL